MSPNVKHEKCFMLYDIFLSKRKDSSGCECGVHLDSILGSRQALKADVNVEQETAIRMILGSLLVHAFLMQ